MKHIVVDLVCLALAAACIPSGLAQTTSANSGTIRGQVLDPSGSAVQNAAVEIQNPVSRYDKSVQTDALGNFEFDNIPYNNYHLSATATGFQGAEQDINVRSPLPLEIKVSLKIGVANESVTVTSAGDLVETDSTSHTDVDRDLYRQAACSKADLLR